MNNKNEEDDEIPEWLTQLQTIIYKEKGEIGYTAEETLHLLINNKINETNIIINKHNNKIDITELLECHTIDLIENAPYIIKTIN